jgi:polyphosphate kinase
VRSIIGRFLEHGRLFHFANGSEDPLAGDFLLGSADWMDRNLSRRVEAIAPVETRHLKERLWEVLQLQLADLRNAWVMQADGSYVQCTTNSRAPKIVREGTHVTLMKRTKQRIRR